MAKGSRGRRRQYRSRPYPLVSYNEDILEELHQVKCAKDLEKKEWEDVTCSVCMECPHNAVLLLCCSYDKGCRPYMCGTSFRYSNCLDQYEKAYTKPISSSTGSAENPILVSDSDKGEQAIELVCPLCRGQVKGWTVVVPAREYLNEKKRSCMQDTCSFLGTYKDLRRHMKADHPCACPRQVDPVLEQKWTRLEQDRERDDAITTIRSTMPGAMVYGDYVIDGNQYDINTDEEVDANEGGFGAVIDSNLVNVLLFLQAVGSLSSNNGIASPVDDFGFSDQDDDNDDGHDGGVSLVSRHRRLILGGSGRRRRQRSQ